MKILPEPLIFDWDQGNIGKNLIKHNVTDKESEEPFVSKPLKLNKDAKHSKKEPRFQALGKTNDERLLFLSFTIRNNRIRIISARDMNKKERGEYEEKT